MSPALVHTVSLLIALAIVVTLHVLLGEMVPKNIAHGRPGAHGDAAGPALSGLRAGRPAVHRVLQPVRQRACCARCGSRPRRARHHGLHRRAQRDDRRVGVRRPAGSRGAHPADSGAADPQPHGRRCGDTTRRHPGGAGGRAGLRADGRGRRKGPGRNRLLAVSGRRRRRPVRRLPAHQGCAVAGRLSASRDRSGQSAAAAPDLGVAALPEALSRMRRSNSHLALVTRPTAPWWRWSRWRIWCETWSAWCATGQGVPEGSHRRRCGPDRPEEELGNQLWPGWMPGSG